MLTDKYIKSYAEDVEVHHRRDFEMRENDEQGNVDHKKADGNQCCQDFCFSQVH